MKKIHLRERAFKRLSFATTIVGILLIAVGLQQLLVAGRVVAFLALAIVGVAVALASVFFELVPEPGFVVTLYTREGCTLCEAARAFLVGKKSEYDLDIWEIDVDTAPGAARYSDLVPVATIGDDELFRLAPDYVLLEAELRSRAEARLRR